LLIELLSDIADGGYIFHRNLIENTPDYRASYKKDLTLSPVPHVVPIPNSGEGRYTYFVGFVRKN
jgi:hypothetical protein